MANRYSNNVQPVKASELSIDKSDAVNLYKKKNWKLREIIFRNSLLASGLIILLLVAGITLNLVLNSIPALRSLGFGFITGIEWNPVNNQFGALPFLAGTVLRC
jgi:phosphate transport system permease protein